VVCSYKVVERRERQTKVEARDLATLARLHISFLPTYIMGEVPPTYCHAHHAQSRRLSTIIDMAGPAKKRQKRENKQDGELPQKKYYRQRAHANPFSDHDLT
jgi:hypothetical protein